MRIVWAIYTETKSKEKAKIILAKISKMLEIELGDTIIQQNDKGGCSCVFSQIISSENWKESVFECLSIAQKVGYFWSVSGNIEEEIDIWSEKIKLTGVKAINATCEKNV